MPVVVAAFVTNAESQNRRRLTQSSQLRKCSRSPLHRAAAFPLQQLRMLSELSALKMFLEASVEDAFCSDRQLEGEVQTAADHSEIVSGSIDHAKTQVVSPTDVARESNFETGPELAEHFGFAAKMVGLRIDSKGVRRSLRMKLVPFAAAENRAHTSPCIRR